MDSILTNPIKVITRADVPAGTRVISLDNSIYARFSEDIQKLIDHPRSEVFRRILHLATDLPLQAEFKVQFLVSQALYYDRLKDKDPDAAAIRLLERAFIANYRPEYLDTLMAWPVARVQAILDLFPEPTDTFTESQEGHVVEIRMTPITVRTDLTEDMREIFNVGEITVVIPLCIYEPGEPEDQVASAFGFPNFGTVSRARICDVCHAASHLRFATADDILLADDKHFNIDALSNVGISCMRPSEFLVALDPSGKIKPTEMD